MDYSHDVSELKLQLLNYIHFQTNMFRKSMNPLVPFAMAWIVVTLLFFSKEGLDIK